MIPWLRLAFISLLLLPTVRALEDVPPVRHGHVPRMAVGLPSLQRLEATQPLSLALGLKLRNPGGLSERLRDIYDPRSPMYRRFLSTAEFTAEFGPTEPDYDAAIAFARTNGMVIRATHPNRLVLDVDGTAAAIERAFQIRLAWYQHPTEPRRFYAPDREPRWQSAVPIGHVSGLENARRPQQMNLRPTDAAAVAGIARKGSGPNGSFLGKDFRAAYVPGTTLTGAGQSIGLFELDGYYATDIAAYRSLAGLASVPLKNVLVDGFNGVPAGRGNGSGNEEVALDIEMAISMAPGAAQVIVYEASPKGSSAQINDVLNRMATDNLAKQIGCSWGFDIDATTQQIFQQYAAQGQSFFLASGDSGAFADVVAQPSDSPYITVVGGTTLTTSATGAWLRETVWSGSGGGISTVFGIPDWQRGIDMSLNQGSTRMRNVPDVAMIANNVWITADRGQSFAVTGTSIAAPLWAGFMALVNQQAAAQGQPPLGFLNPALYAVAQSTNYSGSFHDITTGNTFTSSSPDRYAAVPGYDLCTGLGTPTGTNLIHALLAPPLDPLIISSSLGFLAQGVAGGPFTVSAQDFGLTNASSTAVAWRVGDVPEWLTVSPLEGVLPPQGSATLHVALDAVSNPLLLGSLVATLQITNLSSGRVQGRDFQLQLGNGGFESGDLRDWELTADPNNTFADSVDAALYSNGSTIDGYDDSLFVHDGIYGAFLGQNTTVGFLSQQLPTAPDQTYQISFWMTVPAGGTPSEFSVTWGEQLLFDQTDLEAQSWSHHRYLVSATANATVLKFGFRNDPNAIGLDDIRVLRVASPRLQPVWDVTGRVSFRWAAQIGVSYRLQVTDDLVTPNWTDVGAPVIASDTTVVMADPARGATSGFYRVVLTP